MARPTKPTHLKEMNGSAAHDPQRINKNEPKPKILLSQCPEYFTEEEKLAWSDIVTNIVPGVAFESDRIHIEATAKLLAFIRVPQNLKDPKPPNVSAYAQLTSMLAKLGMNPADRSKINIVTDDDKKDPWEEL